MVGFIIGCLVLHWVCEGICGFMELDSFDKKSMGICYLSGMDGCS